MVGEGGSTEEGGRRRRGLDGEGVPVVEGGREGAGKLRGVTVVLARGVRVGGGAAERRLDGGVKLAGVQGGAAAAF